MSRYWGYHLMLDCAAGDQDMITNADNITAFSKELVERIDMKAFGDPQVVHFAAHDPSKGGYTLVQLIETSNICCHFVDSTGDFYLDVFSCKEFNNEEVVATVRKFFSPKYITEMFVNRNARHALTEVAVDQQVAA